MITARTISIEYIHDYCLLAVTSPISIEYIHDNCLLAVTSYIYDYCLLAVTSTISIEYIHDYCLLAVTSYIHDYCLLAVTSTISILPRDGNYMRREYHAWKLLSSTLGTCAWRQQFLNVDGGATAGHYSPA